MATTKKKTPGDKAIEQLFDRCLTWLCGDDTRLESVTKTLDWIKTGLIVFFSLGIVVPIVTLLIGVALSCFWDWIPVAQFIMIVCILIFGLPTFFFTGIFGSFLATLVSRYVWKETPATRIAMLIQKYFQVIVWVLVFEELYILVGVYAPWRALLIGSLAMMIYLVMSFAFSWKVRWGKWIAGVAQVVLFGWSIGVALPGGFTLWLTGHDLRSEWSFRNIQPLIVNQKLVDDTENKIMVKKGNDMTVNLYEIQKETDGNPALADKDLENLKRPYGENPLIPRTAEVIKNKAKEAYHKIEEKLSK